MARIGLLLVTLLAACGFQALSNGDGGADLVSPTSDLAGADFAGVDFSGLDFNVPPGADLSQPTGGTGPGPAGALPTGYCCAAEEQCRSRRCVQAGTGPYYCADDCSGNSACNAWGGAFTCDQTAGFCVPVNTPYTCLDPAGYQYGTKADGACCANGFAKAGQECLGGLCESTGDASNPFICTQGCNTASPCPPGYSCAARFCWITQTLSDPTYKYTCQ